MKIKVLLYLLLTFAVVTSCVNGRRDFYNRISVSIPSSYVELDKQTMQERLTLKGVIFEQLWDYYFYNDFDSTYIAFIKENVEKNTDSTSIESYKNYYIPFCNSLNVNSWTDMLDANENSNSKSMLFKTVSYSKFERELINYRIIILDGLTVIRISAGTFRSSKKENQVRRLFRSIAYN